MIRARGELARFNRVGCASDLYLSLPLYSELVSYGCFVTKQLPQLPFAKELWNLGFSSNFTLAKQAIHKKGTQCGFPSFH